MINENFIKQKRKSKKIVITNFRCVFNVTDAYNLSDDMKMEHNYTVFFNTFDFMCIMELHSFKLYF